MKVRLLSCSLNPVDIVQVAEACERCSNLREAIASLSSTTLLEREDFVRRLIEAGKEDFLELTSFTFTVEGISFLGVYQLLHHNFIPSVQYFPPKKDIAFTIPDSIQELMGSKTEVRRVVETYLNQSFAVFQTLLQIGVPTEDCAYLLPWGTQTNLLCTISGKGVRNFLKFCLSLPPSSEMRELAEKILEEVSLVALAFVEDFAVEYQIFSRRKANEDEC